MSKDLNQLSEKVIKLERRENSKKKSDHVNEKLNLEEVQEDSLSNRQQNNNKKVVAKRTITNQKKLI